MTAVMQYLEMWINFLKLIEDIFSKSYRYCENLITPSLTALTYMAPGTAARYTPSLPCYVIYGLMLKINAFNTEHKVADYADKLLFFLTQPITTLTFSMN